MDFGHIGNVLSSVLIVVAVAAAAWGALNRETLKTVRDSNKDLLERVGILEDAAERHTEETRAQTERYNSTVGALTLENETLRSVITNEVHLVAIESLVDSHHKAAEVWWADMDGVLVNIKDALERLAP